MLFINTNVNIYFGIPHKIQLNLTVFFSSHHFNLSQLYIPKTAKKFNEILDFFYNTKYLYFVGFKLFKAHDSRKCDQDIIDFLQTQPNKSDTIKQALRDYMTTHPAE